MANIKRTAKLDKLLIQLTATREINKMTYLSRATLTEVIKQLQKKLKEPTRAEYPDAFERAYYDFAESDLLTKHAADKAIKKLTANNQ